MDLVKQGRTPSTFLTKGSFHNAIVALAAIGGSTNAVVHLLAIAGRLGIELSVEDFDRIGSHVPLLVDLQPAGRHLMEDLFRAGGLLAVLRQVKDLLDPEALTITGKPLVDYLDDAEIYDPEVISVRETPVQDDAGIALLRGNLAPDGAIIKPAAATPALLQHRGKALVFDSIEDFHARIDDPDLEVDADSVMILRGCGPKGYPGMPEVSNMPLPTKLLEQGVRDMVRICDGRMSGTAYGTVVLHVAPEAAAGGPLGLVRTGDWIVLDVAGRRLDVELSAEELAAREPSAAMTEAFAAPTRGWGAAVRGPRAAGGYRRRPRLPRRCQRLRGRPRIPLTSGPSRFPRAGSRDEPAGSRDEPAGRRDEPAERRDEPAERRAPSVVTSPPGAVTRKVPVGWYFSRRDLGVTRRGAGVQGLRFRRPSAVTRKVPRARYLSRRGAGLRAGSDGRPVNALVTGRRKALA